MDNIIPHIFSFLLNENSCLLDNKNYYLVNKEIYKMNPCIMYNNICVKHSRSLILQNYFKKRIIQNTNQHINDNIFYIHEGDIMDFDIDEIIDTMTKFRKNNYMLSHKCCSGKGIGILYK
jgi:hypothetical protein